MNSKILASLLFSFVLALPLSASIPPQGPSHEAIAKKSDHYVTDGYFFGGSRSVTASHLVDIRRGPYQGSERIVLELKADSEDSSGVPWYQVQSSQSEGRFLVSLWADVSYGFDKEKVKKAFSKSSRIKRVNVVPRVEPGLAMIELVLAPELAQKKVKFEVFHLSKPSRVIIDIL